MKCNECGSAIEKDDAYCPECGAKIDWAKVDIPAVPRKKSKALFAGISIICILAAAAVGYYIFVMKGNVQAYSNAVSLADVGEHSEAKRIFDSLGDYRDSKDKSIEMGNIILYNDGLAKFDSGDYIGAEASLEKVKGYKDANQLLAEIKYSMAIKNEEEGNIKEARDGFFSVGDYKDAQQRLIEAEERLEEVNFVNYSIAKEEMRRGNYEHALDLFTQLQGYKDSDGQIPEARDGVSYNRAASLYKEGKFYSASTAFRALGSFKDSLQMAEKCLQKTPASKELYRSSEFRGAKDCRLKLALPKESGNDAFIKVYNESEDLVSSVYLNKGDDVEIGLFSGAYSIKVGYGKEWYGAEEAFGQDGAYIVVKNGSATTFEFEEGKLYTLSLFTSGNLDFVTESLSRF